MKADVIIAGTAVTAEPLRLAAPISFWGGVDPATGAIIDARHRDRGANIAGRVLLLPGTIGSSSASAVLLELVRSGRAPAAIILPEPDAILLLGLIVAKEMGWATPMALRLPIEKHAELARTALLALDATGYISGVVPGEPKAREGDP